VLSTPVGSLAENRITDKGYLFVRNIQDLAVGMTMEPMPLEGWEIELVGLINPFRVVIHAENLLEMEQVECEMDTSVLGQRPESGHDPDRTLTGILLSSLRGLVLL
jgi:hypothetical protein